MSSSMRNIWSIGAILVVVSIFIYGVSRPVDSPSNSTRLDNADRLDVSSELPVVSITKHDQDKDVSATPIPNTATIDFGEYGSVDVGFRERPYHKREWPISLAQDIASLEEEANRGSVSASRLLHQALNHCQSFPYKTKDDYDEGMNTLQQTQTFKTIVRGKEYVGDSYPGDTETFSTWFTLCEGITLEQEEKHLDWLKHAADLGDPQSASELGAQWLGNTTEGRAYLERAFASGWYDAAGHLGYFNTGHVLYSVTQPAEDVANDRIAAHAYTYLYAKLLDADGLLKDNFARLTRQALHATENQLSPYELRESTKLAAKILQEQSNCCYTRLPAAHAKNRAQAVPE